MGRKSITDKIEEIKENISDGNIKDIFSEITEILNNNEKEMPKEWISTGIKSLNFLLSGNVDLGIPSGDMIVVAGEPQSGKSILGARIAANSQKSDYFVIWLDSEHASSDQLLERWGIDMKRARRKDISTVDEFQIISLRLLNWAKKNNKKLFIVLDSIGNLSGAKEVSDAEDEKITGDMGQRAKNIKTAVRHIIHELSKTGSILYCVNHIYIAPGFIPKKEMAGGLAVAYLGQIVLFLTRNHGEDGIFTKVKMKSKKNREFIEGRTTEFLINYREGFDDVGGLLELFKEFGVIKEKGSWFTIENDEKSYREKDIRDNEELLNKLLELLKEKTKNFNYHFFTN